MKNSLYLFLVLLFWISCEQKSNKSSLETDIDSEFPDLFLKILDAHGGLESWNQYSYLEYEINRGSGSEVHRIDLKSRKSRIDKAGKYSLGYDGSDIWVSPNRDSFPGSSPRFVHNLHFYFFAIPFVLADPGVNYEDAGEVTIDGKNYLVLKTTFDDQIGDAPDDQYLLYVDPTSFKMDFINYSVTFYDKEKATTYNALDYKFSNVGGLLLPSGYTGYHWESGGFGEKRYEAIFTNINLLKTVPNPSIFEIPEGAWIEPIE